MARSPDGLKTWKRKVQLSEDELAETWREYRRTESDEVRNRLTACATPSRCSTWGAA